MKGDKGDKGDTGASAYEIAVRNGFKGTEAEWTAQLPGKDDPNAMHYDDPDGTTATMRGATGTQIRNVADATADTDAANLQQVRAGNSATLASAKSHADAGDAAMLTSAKSYTDASSANAVRSANSYTDSKVAAWNDTFTKYQQAVDQRFIATDRRISQIGAMSNAMSQMTANAVPTREGKGRIAIGVGVQSGDKAVSIGFGKRLPGGASFTFGASASRNEISAGAGLGFDL